MKKLNNKHILGLGFLVAAAITYYSAEISSFGYPAALAPLWLALAVITFVRGDIINLKIELLEEMKK